MAKTLYFPCYGLLSYIPWKEYCENPNMAYEETFFGYEWGFDRDYDIISDVTGDGYYYTYFEEG